MSFARTGATSSRSGHRGRRAFLDQVFDASLPHLMEHSAVYCRHAHVQQPTIASVFERHGLLLHQVLVR
jgi:hypothetical protein